MGNNYIRRTIGPMIAERMFRGKAIMLTGARQVGKSTLLGHLAQATDDTVLHLNCDDPEVRALLQSPNLEQLRLLVGNNRIVLIDEAQRIPGIGLTLKLIVDNMPNVQLLVSGSSSIELQRNLEEPLTGRKYEFRLYPFSVPELYDAFGFLSIKQNLETRLLYGSYPDVVIHPSEARELLTELTGSYLFKDILAMDNVRRPELLNKILVALALQTGSEVSYNELAKTVGSDNKTVERYIDLLEQSYVVFRLGAFARNLRNELKKSRKIYFYDLGVRNAVLGNFSPLSMRSDVGAIWENYFIAERIKRNDYLRSGIKSYFWRTTSQQEIDYIEELDGKIYAFEFKWNPSKANISLPVSFVNTYKPEQTAVVTPDNYLQFLIG